MTRCTRKLAFAVLLLLIFAIFVFVACDDDNVAVAKNLQFSLGHDGTYYMVSGIGNEKRTIFEIPSEYEGLPVKKIDSSAFRECGQLTKIVIPDSITSIEDNAFAFCTNLTNIILSESITYIGKNVFEGCSNLTNIVIPTSVERIDREAFKGCTSLATVDWNAKACKTAGSGTYQYTIFSGCTSLTTVNFGSKVTIIPAYTLYNCRTITAVNFEENSHLKLIGEFAFDGCGGLTNIVIPSSIYDTRIDQHAFANCYSLTRVVIPSSVTTIISYAFRDCGNLVIYCEAKQEPHDWWPEWNFGKYPVIWGYVAEK